MRDTAQEIADSALRSQRGGEAQRALIHQCMTAVVEAGQLARRERNGRELAIFEKDFAKIATLVDALLEGNYRETAAQLAGIAPSGIRAWLQAADGGEPRYQPIATLVRAAEAIAEAECVSAVRKAGKDPRNWTASMTWLERKFPERYGRRTEESNAPKVVVINAKDSPVQVNVGAGYALSPQVPGAPVSVGLPRPDETTGD
jgi:hypothetical protein